MPDFTVRNCGTDTSGRAILMTAFMAEWWEAVVAELGFRPTIVQGAFMARAGGGASASAGYHDAAGCLDLRTWDRSAAEVEQMVRTLRRFGAAAWVRDERHGMDPHLHFVLGADYPLASGAAGQWRDYLAGYDGLASRGRDYEWRPNPIVTTPPEVDPMAQYEDDLKRIESKVDKAIERINTVAKNTAARDKATRERDAKRFKRQIELGLQSGRSIEAIAYALASEDS